MRFYKYLVVAVVIALLAALWIQYHPPIDTSPASVTATPIDLSHYENAKLTDALNCSPDGKGNDLAALPTGRQVMANVPFDISGIAQVTGLRIQSWGRHEYPAKITDISINKRCRRLFILHGAGGVGDPEGTTIAKLVLHYEDKSTRIIEIKIGDHVRDWWGDPKEPMLNKGSELGWKGRNAAIRNGAPGQYLRLYRSTFANPKRNLTITTIDYVSTFKASSSFLVGLTVD